MEKLTKSLSLFKERNCSVSVVLDSRTRRKNACEFPLSLRFTIDRKCFFLCLRKQCVNKRFELARFTHRISMKLRAILRHTPLGYVVNLTILGG